MTDQEFGAAMFNVTASVVVLALIVWGVIAIMRNNADIKRKRAANTANASPAAPNWYTDPEHPDQLRYWDGTQWTEHRAPKHPN